MSDTNRLDQLEKRVQAMANTLIQVQIEMQKIREAVQELSGKEVPKGEPAVMAQAEKEPSVVSEEARSTQTEAISATPAVAATGAVPPPVAPAEKPKRNIEAFIGGKLLTIIGIIVLVLGLGYFVKYAIDNDLIGPIGRVTLGLMSGLTLVAIAFRLKAQYRAFSAVLLSGGMATMYFSVFTAFIFYDLIPRELTFAVMVLLTAFTVMAAVMYNMQIIGIIGLVGAYAVPVLLSDQSGRVVILFSYMTLVNLGILILAFRKNWTVLTQSALAFSWIIYLLWFADTYTYEKHFTLALIFSSVFFVMFYLMTVAFKLIKKVAFGVMDVISLTVNSFIYYGVAYRIFNDVYNGDLLGLMTLGVALFHLIFAFYTTSVRLTDRRFFYLQIGLAITFLVIAVPVQLEGNWITMVWSLGALLLLTIGRTQKVIFYERLGYGLILLALISLLADWGKMKTYADALKEWMPFSNAVFITSVVFVLSLAGMVALMRMKKYQTETDQKISLAVVVRILLTIILSLMTYALFSREIHLTFERLYILSTIEIPGDFPVSVRDTDIRLFAFLWSYNYAVVFFALYSFLVLRYWNYPAMRWSLVTINTIILFVFIFGVIPQLGTLRALYMDNPNAAYYHQGPFYILIRYVCYLLTALLIYSQWRLIGNEKPVLRKIYLVFLHGVAVIVLSAELTTWMILSQSKEWMSVYADWSRRVWYSVLWGLYSLSVVTYGILRKVRYLRLTAITFFGITLLKIVFFDLANLGTAGRIIVFIGLGILLLIAAFLYQKYKTIIFGSDEHEQKS